MNRLGEVEGKHARLRQLLEGKARSTLWLRRPRNLSWLTAGAESAIDMTGQTASYSILVSAEKRVIVTDNIELPRLRKEARLEDLGFEFSVSNWYAFELPPMPDGLCDLDAEVECELQRLRWVLDDNEQIRLRALGFDTAAALEEAMLAATPGETEWQIAARLDAACRQRGGVAVVCLIATDERVALFRHPFITEKPLERLLLISLCMRRGGLVAAATRIAHFGELPADLREKMDKTAIIDAAVMDATRPGRALRDAFAALQAAYASQGEADQWKQHHQGGIIGYRSRERLAAPGDATLIEAGQAFAWNPSIVGCKSEDTILLGVDGFEIVTRASKSWASVEVGIAGQTISRPVIQEV